VPTVLKSLDRASFLAHVWESPALAEAASALLVLRVRRTNAYLDYVTEWAYLVAEGHYDEARRAVADAAAEAIDTHSARFLGTFAEMIDSVRAREAALAEALAALRIEIDQQQQAQRVSSITNSDFFQSLQSKAEDLRQRRHGREAAGG
jgi:hypothetical protein